MARRLFVMTAGLAASAWTSASPVAAQADVVASDDSRSVVPDDEWLDMPVDETASTTETNADVASDEAFDWGEPFGYFGVELTFFFLEPLAPTQPEHFNASLVFEPGHTLQIGEHLTLRGRGLLRVDQSDSQRTHGDVREAFVQLAFDDFTGVLGVNRVFWGVTESRHLVDIVNQTDYAEDLDGDAKLGQLMTMLSFDTGAPGLFDVIVMTWFRPLLFPGIGGRPGPPLPILAEPDYESSAGQWHFDLAARWSLSVGALDAALSYFRGTSREPEFVPAVGPTGPAFQTHYSQIQQGGLELQWTPGSWLVKLESIVRYGQGPSFFAVTGGFEHTFSSVFGSDVDVAVLLEYSYDGRDNLTYNFMDNDVFLGSRLSLNDEQSTEVTLGVITDLASGVTVGSLEASRRIAGSWKLALEGRAIFAEDEQDLLHWFRCDHYVRAELEYHY